MCLSRTCLKSRAVLSGLMAYSSLIGSMPVTRTWPVREGGGAAHDLRLMAEYPSSVLARVWPALRACCCHGNVTIAADMVDRLVTARCDVHRLGVGIA